MSHNPEINEIGSPQGPALEEQDILEAMKRIPGYLDITPGDFKEVYQLAYHHALERLRREVTAGEIMTREVVTVQIDTPLADVAQAMGHRGISGVPVLDAAGQVVGMISEKDFLRQMGAESANFMSLVAQCLKSKGCVALPIKKQKAEDLMSSPAITVREETSVQEIAGIFIAQKINRVAVTDPAGRLHGIVSRGDIIKATRHRAKP
jgi:CBS domain-containing protein